VNTITRCELHWMMRHAWLPARELTPGAIIEDYLAQDRLRCCSFQLGFYIDLDHEVWSDDGTCDEPWMTMVWFRALDALLDGATRFGPNCGPWEESQLTWERRGASLHMQDIHHTGAVSMRPVVVAFDDLAAQITREGERMAEIVREVLAECTRRRAGAARSMIEMLDEIATQLPQPDDLALIERVRQRLG
jgi:hypothetical protein